jgi:hypothetical protein
MAADRMLRPLGLTITPYRAQIVIFSAITVFALSVAYVKDQPGFVWAATLIWALFAGSLYIGLQYRVLWDNSGLVMRASGGKERCIQYHEIASVTLETGVSEISCQSRPFRRIVVTPLSEQPDSFIDISLRHFQREDIDQLLANIRSQRPDLEVPTIPWGKGSL